jgi:hypothetical protein
LGQVGRESRPEVPNSFRGGSFLSKRNHSAKRPILLLMPFSPEFLMEKATEPIPGLSGVFGQFAFGNDKLLAVVILGNSSRRFLGFVCCLVHLQAPLNKKGGFPVPANHPTAVKAKAFEKIAGSFQGLSYHL